MDDQKMNRMLEDIAYLRGRFDTIVPEIQKNSENTNLLLQMHNERLSSLEKEQVFIKTKVGFFGSVAGVVGGIIVSLIINLLNKQLF